ncbi:MAG: phenylalanine--tRNA ligase subunit alpha [Erysipelotrichaceae bacterium]|nr:phenylalanine--tRNA ligase subunit alpha [Erysipelotrichaceae bacterium]MBQ7890126.1 phenylalanine--tRNA ligase subunit alpha [Erysipelotrichaceae bacterium]
MEKVELVKQEALNAIEQCTTLEQLNQVRVTYLGKKGPIQSLMTLMKNLSAEEKPAFGAEVNACKQAVAAVLEEKKTDLEQKAMDERLEKEKIDVTLPAMPLKNGTLHPLTLVTQEMEDLFISMGYSIGEGPEVELDLYNFERANIPADHPARDMQDTFYINPEVLLRTHTTAIQMRELEKAGGKLPLKVICPGKVYRRDDDDATHSHQFMQCEGLVVAENITLADLKGTLSYMADRMFGKGRDIRFRPSYFQFTEPSVEVDVSCHMCGGKGCPVCKGTGWIEVLGGGMVHPNVLEMAGFDSKKCSGFAFGVGVERVAMLKYGVDDIRNFYINDARFLKMFDRFD